MPDHLIIDAHAHTYATRELGLQAMQGAGHCSYTGLPEELLDAMRRGGTSKAVMVNMLPLWEMVKAAQAKLPEELSDDERRRADADILRTMLARQERRNLWTCTVAREHPELVPFIHVVPWMGPEALRQEIEDKVKTHGARGIKLHPGSNEFFPYDRRMWPAYELAAEFRLPVVSHAGLFITSNIPYTHPDNFAEAAEHFPQVTFVLAHLAFNFWDASIALARRCPNVFFDCSAVVSELVEEPVRLTDERLAALIREIGVERVMWGSDFPWFDPVEGLHRLQRLDFTAAELRLLTGENAVRILGL